MICYAQVILPMNNSNLEIIPRNTPALDRWLDSSRNSLYSHVSSVGTFPLLSPLKGIVTLPAIPHWTTLEAQHGNCRGGNRSGEARRGGEHWEPHLPPKPLPTGRELIFLETCEQMSEGSNLSCNQFLIFFFCPLCYSDYENLCPFFSFFPYFHSSM